MTTKAQDTSINIGTKKEFFAWLPNCVVYEMGLSAEAVGVALYLHGKPSGWRARPFDIKKHFRLGDRGWYRVSKELKGAGLLHERKVQSGTELWFELPDMVAHIVKKPAPQKGSQPDVSSTCQIDNLSKRQALAKKDNLTNKDLITKKDLLCEKDIKLIFDKLWDAYPLKKAKAKALEALSKLLKGKARAEAEVLAKAIWDGLMAHLDEHHAKKDLESQGAKIWVPELPHLSTWINQNRWEDGYTTPEQILAAAKPKSSILDINTVF